jgi:hypothetical protein
VFPNGLTRIVDTSDDSILVSGQGLMLDVQADELGALGREPGPGHD